MFFSLLFPQSGRACRRFASFLLFMICACAPVLPAHAATRGLRVDYDGDGKTDYALFRPSQVVWYVIPSSTGVPVSKAFGIEGDIPIIGDYDGDGKTDYALFRPSDGTWYVTLSSTGAVVQEPFGEPGDIPVPGDYDGDGKTDHAVFRPSNGTWYILQSSTGTEVEEPFGEPTDIPVPGDYDGDGKTDYGVFRPSNGTWYILQSSTGTEVEETFGEPSDIPVPGDYDGDGKTDHAVFRPSNGTWYVLQSSTGGEVIQQFGTSGDIPVPGDYDGDGKTDMAVFRPSQGIWYVIPTSTGNPISQQFGTAEDFPMSTLATAVVTISGSPGVPLNGVSNYSVQLSSGQQISLFIIGTGAGQATFDNGSSSLSLTQSGQVQIHGNATSSTAGDVEVVALSQSNVILARFYISVVSVQISLRTSGGFSPDNTANKPANSLGTQIAVAFPDGPYCSSVVEYLGVITPTNYQGTVILRRSVVGETFVNEQAVDSLLGDDTSQDRFRVDRPTTAGHVYDVDAPGIYPEVGSTTDIARIRHNFTEYAVLDSASGPTAGSQLLLIWLTQQAPIGSVEGCPDRRFPRRCGSFKMTSQPRKPANSTSRPVAGRMASFVPDADIGERTNW